MQVSGKLLVTVTFAIGLIMASGSWWYNYQQSRRAAQFWGAHDASLLVGEAKVELLELTVDPPAEADAAPNPPAPQALIAGLRVLSAYDLTGKHGLVHLRHALTYDDNFDWDQRSEEPLGNDDWAYALRFTKADGTLVVLFTRDFTLLGKLADESLRVDVLPCPRLGPVIIDYLRQNDVGAIPPVDAK